jgi:hypothetical protein
MFDHTSAQTAGETHDINLLSTSTEPQPPFTHRGSPMSVLKAWIKKVLPRRLMAHLQAWDHYHHGEPEIRLISQLA